MKKIVKYSKCISTRFSKEAADKLNEIANENNLNIAEVVRDFVMRALEEKTK